MVKPVLVIAVAGLLASTAIGLVAWWPQRVSGAGPIAAAAAASGPPIGGSVEDFRPIDPPRPTPDATFLEADGGSIQLSALRGRIVLLNFWATWCGPCVEEMPSLDRLQGRMASDDFAVVALSEDRGMPTVERFFKKLGLARLGRYLDPDNGLQGRLGINALPTTMILDRDGRALGALVGAAQWDSPEALALIRYYLDRGKDGGDAEVMPTSG